MKRVFVFCLFLLVTGCATPGYYGYYYNGYHYSGTYQGAAIGGAAGALIGAGAGGRPGALFGAGIGTILGAFIGTEADIAAQRAAMAPRALTTCQGRYGGSSGVAFTPECQVSGQWPGWFGPQPVPPGPPAPPPAPAGPVVTPFPTPLSRPY